MTVRVQPNMILTSEAWKATYITIRPLQNDEDWWLCHYHSSFDSSDKFKEIEQIYFGETIIIDSSGDDNTFKLHNAEDFDLS